MAPKVHVFSALSSTGFTPHPASPPLGEGEYSLKGSSSQPRFFELFDHLHGCCSSLCLLATSVASGVWTTIRSSQAEGDHEVVVRRADDRALRVSRPRCLPTIVLPSWASVAEAAGQRLPAAQVVPLEGRLDHGDVRRVLHHGVVDRNAVDGRELTSGRPPRRPGWPQASTIFSRWAERVRLALAQSASRIVFGSARRRCRCSSRSRPRRGTPRRSGRRAFRGSARLGTPARRRKGRRNALSRWM